MTPRRLRCHVSYRRLARVAAGLMLTALVAGSVVAAASGKAEDSSPEARAERLSAVLRCPVCQGLSVADSPSTTARDIRDDLRRRVDAGQNDDEILDAYRDRYGEWILLRPPSEGLGALVWGLPILAFGLGAVGLTIALWRWRRGAGVRATAGDRRLVAEALAQYRSTDRGVEE